MSSAYLMLLIFLLEILIPACASSSPAFHMMCSVYELKKEGDDIEPLMYSFPNLEPVSSSFFFSVYSFFNINLFNWRLITLQYCIGFAIHQHESATGVHVFPILNPLSPPSPYHPSGSSQCTSSEHTVSCIKPGLAIHFTYDNIHVSMPFSQIIPPSPSPTESKRLYRTVF